MGPAHEILESAVAEVNFGAKQLEHAQNALRAACAPNLVRTGSSFNPTRKRFFLAPGIALKSRDQLRLGTSSE